MEEAQVIQFVDHHQQADGMQLFQFVDQHQQIVGKICRLYKYTGADKEDLYKEIVFQLWKSAATDNEKMQPGYRAYRTALATAIVHNIINTKRLPDTLQTLMLLTDQHAELNNALKQLPDSDKALMALYLEDLNYTEIATITGLPETVIGVKLNRIKKKVQQALSDNQPSSIRYTWQNITTSSQSDAKLTEIIAERSAPFFNIQNGFITHILSKSLAKENDIKKTLEDVLKKIKQLAVLAVASRTVIFAGLMLFARFTITNNTALLWVLASALLLFGIQITLISKTWAKKIGQMKFTIDHFRSQREFGKKGAA
jgi:RNA polymerase sigma factor (sigma-70 family)